MSELETIIKYDPESTILDFKKDQYPREKFKELIKDIMAMANVTREGKRYIITGVKDLPGGDKQYHPISRDEFVDQAIYQQILRENVEPTIEFSYYPFEIEGDIFGVFEIDNCYNPPYMMKKDFNGLSKGDCYIRKGSQQAKMTRADLEEILLFRSKLQFHGKISVGFNESLDNRIQIEAIKEFELPSKTAEIKINKILNDRKNSGQMGNETLSLLFAQSSFFGGNNSYESRSTETLIKNLDELQETYLEDDWYCIGEVLSEKINLVFKNEGDSYLEDVSLEIKFPSKGIIVMNEIKNKPSSQSILTRPSMDFYEYPQVEKLEGFYVVSDNIGNLKHHQITKAFDENLRIFFSPDAAGKNLICPYTIYAKNLPRPIVGNLEIEVK